MHLVRETVYHRWRHRWGLLSWMYCSCEGGCPLRLHSLAIEENGERRALATLSYLLPGQCWAEESAARQWQVVAVPAFVSVHLSLCGRCRGHSSGEEVRRKAMPSHKGSSRVTPCLHCLTFPLTLSTLRYCTCSHWIARILTLNNWQRNMHNFFVSLP